MALLQKEIDTFPWLTCCCVVWVQSLNTSSHCPQSLYVPQIISELLIEMQEPCRTACTKELQRRNNPWKASKIWAFSRRGQWVRVLLLNALHHYICLRGHLSVCLLEDFSNNVFAMTVHSRLHQNFAYFSSFSARCYTYCSICHYKIPNCQIE